ncbi:YbcC family protein [Reichenbachiella ulvae]|uniref:Probable inorganic carbon transporter subunit DabA n=1 Tax=Reichenbachiella ulvae TaxID=2980104 RepID=A0ABT3CSD6_9BACT|nr:DUF2309 domain-containing protein [Reichenbachiella ulvae]MCV9386621.1 DUF2309 domain-containing protein [Reichenbachiella ulvae]
MNKAQIQAKIEKACSRIAPAWPLDNSVAVNPYLGLSDMTFEQAAQTMNERGGVQLYMPIPFYLEKIERGEITHADIKNALTEKSLKLSVDEFLNQLDQVEAEGEKRKFTLMSVAEAELETELSEIMIDHTSHWLSVYFSKRQMNQGSAQQLYSQWKNEAEIDLMPELKGMKTFRKEVKSLPDDPISTILYGLEKLSIPEASVEAYLHALLMQMIGWSSYCAGQDWQNNLYGGEGKHLQSLLAILMGWELSLLSSQPKLKSSWERALDNLEDALEGFRINKNLVSKSVLQDAFDWAHQRQLAEKFATASNAEAKTSDRPQAQMVFCIDVRSEVYRRNLEAVNDRIETIGFAGFFGFPIKYKPINHADGRNQCPVLIPSGPQVHETTAEEKDLAKEQKSRLLSGKLEVAWSKFKSGSGSSFSFVSPVGLFYLPKLISDSLGWTRPIHDPKEKEFGSLLSGKGRLELAGIPFEDRVKMAQSALNAMGLTQNFAPLVLITGHGASSVNNPHASGLDCGACGGNSGEVNAITAQLILNDREVRSALQDSGIEIPEDTYFMACLHNTTTDEITVIDENSIPATHHHEYLEVKDALVKASALARKNRSERFGIKQADAIMDRAKDWSQVRPEWGLAGCSSFVIAPRERTKGINLEGRAFLHSYQHQNDEGYKVLEAIMTAPMIVTSWINLQYYASTVDNKRLGAGNKTLHNVTGGFGVLEGAKGDLRIGLPFQSIHDGTQYQHQPLRLNVIIEAPIEAINEVLNKHANVKELCDHQWINLMVLDDHGQISHRYIRDCQWEDLQKDELTQKENLVETL